MALLETVGPFSLRVIPIALALALLRRRCTTAAPTWEKIPIFTSKIALRVVAGSLTSDCEPGSISRAKVLLHFPTSITHPLMRITLPLSLFTNTAFVCFSEALYLLLSA
jgi:hypothetical protein